MSNYDMDDLNAAMLNLIAKGLVDCGPNEEGEIVFWATELGKEYNYEGTE